MDIREKSIELCNKLANSFYDRDPVNPNPVFFSINEINLVESFLLELLDPEKPEAQ